MFRLLTLAIFFCSLVLSSCVRESVPEPEIEKEAIAEESNPLSLPDFEAIHGKDRLKDTDGSYLAGGTDPFLVQNIDVMDPDRSAELNEVKEYRKNLDIHIKEVIEWRLLGLFETPEGIPSQPKPTASFLGSVYNDADYDPSTGNVLLGSEGGSSLILNYTKYKLSDSKPAMITESEMIHLYQFHIRTRSEKHHWNYYPEFRDMGFWMGQDELIYRGDSRIIPVDD